MNQDHFDDCTCHYGTDYRTNGAVTLAGWVIGLIVATMFIGAMRELITGVAHVVSSIDWLAIIMSVAISIVSILLVFCFMVWAITAPQIRKNERKADDQPRAGKAFERILSPFRRLIMRMDMRQKGTVETLDHKEILAQAEHHIGEAQGMSQQALEDWYIAVMAELDAHKASKETTKEVAKAFSRKALIQQSELCAN